MEEATERETQEIRTDKINQIYRLFGHQLNSRQLPVLEIPELKQLLGDDITAEITHLEYLDRIDIRYDEDAIFLKKKDREKAKKADRGGYSRRRVNLDPELENPEHDPEEIDENDKELLEKWDQDPGPLDRVLYFFGKATDKSPLDVRFSKGELAHLTNLEDIDRYLSTLEGTEFLEAHYDPERDAKFYHLKPNREVLEYVEEVVEAIDIYDNLNPTEEGWESGFSS